MKKIFNLIFVLFIILLSSCSTKYDWYHLEAQTFYDKYENIYSLVYTWNHEKSDNKIFKLAGIDYEKNNIDYILVGDVLKVKSDALAKDLSGTIPGGRWFNTVKNVKIKRAPTKKFEVISNEKNTKVIVCEDTSIEFKTIYSNSEQVIFTKQVKQSSPYDHLISYDFITLKEVDVGTKLVGTVYTTDNGYGVYAFYFESFFN